MIHIVPRSFYAYYRRELTAMHRLRHEVFVERLGWDVKSEHGLERDAFDDLDPVYVLALTDDGRVDGTWRLLPTTGPTMLADCFPGLLDGAPAPRSPAIWETSRFAVAGGALGAEGLAALSRVTGELFCGLVEYAIGAGIAEIVTVYDIRIGRLLDRLGCRPTHVSRRQRLGNTIAVAGRFEISQRVLAELRRNAGIDVSVLAAAPAEVPLVAAE
jgi:acyl homoserine lactone synthase